MTSLPIDVDALARKIVGRKVADSFCEMILEETSKFPTEDHRRGFWDRVVLLLREQGRLPSTTPVPVPHAMSNEEAKDFEKEVMPFGEYKDQTVSWVMQHHPEYIRWLLGQSFMRKLNRYAGNPDIERALWPDE